MILDVKLQAHLPSVTDFCVHAAMHLLPLRKGQVCTHMCTGPVHIPDLHAYMRYKDLFACIPALSPAPM